MGKGEGCSRKIFISDLRTWTVASDLESFVAATSIILLQCCGVLQLAFPLRDGLDLNFEKLTSLRGDTPIWGWYSGDDGNHDGIKGCV